MNALPFITAVFSNRSANPPTSGERLPWGSACSETKESIPAADERHTGCRGKAPSWFSPGAFLLQGRGHARTVHEAAGTAGCHAAGRSDIALSSAPGGNRFSALMTLAESQDPHVSRNAIGILGSTRDPRATDLLLKLLTDPGPRDVRCDHSAPGRHPRPAGSRSAARSGKDPARRAGKEVELGDALAALGDQRSAAVIAGPDAKKSKPGRVGSSCSRPTSG